MVLKNYTHKVLASKHPLNIDFQIQAVESLRKGIEEYDKRKGWRGPYGK